MCVKVDDTFEVEYVRNWSDITRALLYRAVIVTKLGRYNNNDDATIIANIVLFNDTPALLY